METLGVLASRLAGNPGPLGWIQAYEYIPPDEELLEARGKLFVLIFIDFENEEISRFSEGREVLAKIQNEYYEKKEIGSFEALKLALDKAILEYQIEGKKINIAAASYINNILYVAVTGNVQAGVIREGASVKILVGHPGEVISASGFPKEKDVFILGTNIFFEAFTDNDIKDAFVNSPTEQIPEKFESKILSSQDLLGVGVVALKFGGKEEEKLPIISQEEELPKANRTFGGFTKIGKTISNILEKVNEKLPRKRITIHEETQVYEDLKDRKKLSSVGIILLIILIISIVFGIRQNKLKTERSKYADDLSRATHSFEESLKILSIDKERSIQLFLEAKGITDGLSQRNIKNEEFSKLLTAMGEKEGEILGEYQSGAQLYMDLSLIIDNFSSRDAVSSGSDVAFLDGGGKKAITLDLESKRAEAVSGMDNVGDGKRIAVYEGRAYVLNNDGIDLVGKDSKRVIEKEWGEDTFIKSYGGNIYLFDRGNSTIYRYPGLTSGFASKQLWLAPGIKPDFSDMTSWAIDGSIWVGYGDGEIEKYTQGSPKGIEIRGISTPLKDITSLFSNGDTKDVYILDKGNSRIVVIDKDGNYICQYNSGDLGNATDLFVSEVKKQAIYLIGGNKLQYIELKHI